MDDESSKKESVGDITNTPFLNAIVISIVIGLLSVCLLWLCLRRARKSWKEPPASTVATVHTSSQSIPSCFQENICDYSFSQRPCRSCNKSKESSSEDEEPSLVTPCYADCNTATETFDVRGDYSTNLQLHMDLDEESRNLLREIILEDATSSANCWTLDELSEDSTISQKLYNERKMVIKKSSSKMISSGYSQEIRDEANCPSEEERLFSV
jgi:hypothetical protein